MATPLFNSPTVLLVGSYERHAGKTEFSCSMIRKVAAHEHVTGAKITVIRENEDGGCHHACKEKGCGKCPSLDGRSYLIIEEKQMDTGKDTARMLAAGASRVYWMLVRESKLEEGMSALLATLKRETPPGSPVVMESNSASKVLKPAYFLMVKTPEPKGMRDSAREVLDRVDRFVISDGRSFTPSPETLDFTEGTWLFMENRI